MCESWEGKAPTEYHRISIFVRRVVSTDLQVHRAYLGCQAFPPFEDKSWRGESPKQSRFESQRLQVSGVVCVQAGLQMDGREAGSGRQPPEPRAQMLTTMGSSGAIVVGLGCLGHLKEVSHDWHSCCSLLCRLLGGGGLPVGYIVGLFQGQRHA